MINLRRLSKYLLAYVILLIIAALITVEKIIRPIDLAVYNEYYLKSELVKNYKDEFLNKEAIWPLIEKDIKIYAPYRLPDKDDDLKFEDIKFEDHDEKQAYSLYDDYFTSGRLNTQFYNHEKVNGLVTYYSFEVISHVYGVL